MKKQNILKAGLFLALAAQISWNTHQADRNKNNVNHISFASSLNYSNTVSHRSNNEVIYDNVEGKKTLNKIKVQIGDEEIEVGAKAQVGFKNICATSSQSFSLLNMGSSTTRPDTNNFCENGNINTQNAREYANQALEAGMDVNSLSEVLLEMENLPKDFIKNLQEEINLEVSCDNCGTVTTNILASNAGITDLSDINNKLSAALNKAAKKTADERKEKERKFKEFKRKAKRMQLCETHTPEDLEEVLYLDDADDLKIDEVDYSLISKVLESRDTKRYRSNSKNRIECQRDRFTKLADDDGLVEEAEEFFFKHMQSDLMDFIRSNPIQARSIVDDLGMVAGLGLDEWDAHIGLDSSYAALQMMNTELKYRDTLIDYADALRNPQLNPYQRQTAFYNLHKLRENYTSRINLINSHEDRESDYYNDLTVLGKGLSDSIGFNLTTLYCDAGMQMGVYPDYRCSQTSGRSAADVYKEMASVKISDGVRGEFPIEFIDMISDARQSLVPQKYERYTYTNEGFSPSIVTDRYNINDFINNTTSLPRLSDAQRNNIIRNRQRGQF